LLLLYKTEKRGRWLTVRERAEAWLVQHGKLPADVLWQFKTKNNTLSVYALDVDRRNAARIVAAILSSKDAHGGLDSTDCLIFESNVVDAVGIAIKEVPGLTPDVVANTWHRDLVEISADQLVAFSEALIRHAEMETLLEDELVAALKLAWVAGSVRKESLSKKARVHIDSP
jgi:hypothetical protein